MKTDRFSSSDPVCTPAVVTIYKRECGTSLLLKTLHTVVVLTSVVTHACIFNTEPKTSAQEIKINQNPTGHSFFSSCCLNVLILTY